jgi:hypothetical protein
MERSTVLFADGTTCIYPDDYGGWKRRGRTLADYLRCQCGQADCWLPEPVAVLPAILTTRET